VFLTLERYRILARQCAPAHRGAGLLNVSVRHADGGNGMASEGPFDRIVVWAAFDSLPRSFVDQISSGGVLIAPIGPAEGEQVWAKLTKVGSRFEREDIGTLPSAALAAGLAAAI
jgi:protein-L-isoaspartate(D-aspartate) O-methyltransferase